MKHLKKINMVDKIYTHIKIEYDDAEYYQVPFYWFYSNKGFGKNNEYKLFLSEHFVYDYITDEDIKNELNNDLSNVDLNTNWVDVAGYSGNNIDNIHTKRIAKIILGLLKNVDIPPISFWFDENSFYHDCINFIEDGNHRIRSLQYLKYTHFPAYIHGSHAKYIIEYLK